MPVKPAPLPTIPQPSLVEKIRRTENKTLRRFAPTTISSSGRPRVVIPDVVFKKGAEIHKDFIICYFNGRAPPFSQIQSVFNHMWGKEKRLEIHNNPLTHSALVRIPSDYLRQKILEKSIWYVGDSMFHTAQWSSIHSKSTPPLKAIKIWAHITGIPLDLRHEDGYSLIAGLIGEPKETDDFTKNLVSLTLSNVKIEVDLSQPLPAVVEFEREDGEVVEVTVTYPWVPPTCSHCHELGHIVRNCLLFTPPSPTNSNPTPKKAPAAKSDPRAKKKYQPVQNIIKPTSSDHKPADPPPSLLKTTSPLFPEQQPSLTPNIPPATFTKKKPLDPRTVTSTNILTPNSFQLLDSNPFSTPTQTPSPSLKRSRSSPTLTPPEASTNTSNPNPFVNLVSVSDSSSFKPPDLNHPSFLSNTTSTSFVPGDSSILSKSRQSITCRIIIPHKPPIYYTAVYASNQSDERNDLWAELIHLHSTLSLDDSCWFFGVDLNQIIHPDDHSDPVVNAPDYQMYLLRDCMTQLGLFDLRYTGTNHSWTNSQPAHPIAKKLDRLLCNSVAIASYPHALANFLPPNFSGHLPCILDLAFNLPQEMSELVVGHFQSVLGPRFYTPPSMHTAPTWFQLLTGYSCPQQMSDLMLSLPTTEEIKSTFYKLNPNKAPSPDGLTSAFFKTSWETLGNEVVSVWVQWFKEVILKGSLQNYWTTPPRQSFSWLVNKLLKLKDEVFPLIKLRLGNGETARFWADNWSPFGNLHTFLAGSNSRLGISENATISSLYRNGGWRLPPVRSNPQLQLYTYLTTIQLQESEDYYEW
ncbi:hypothetical protein IGI04_019496 [Brassica rapa subsp. trilocularis]|uniref:DUF4283 domain-containing protein n=1 Tax=Brassica rapa subsp. trilocularis TaxID=1813537 RepID=A0ABQ7MG02_BRACM|nr:hypothetical protein IGI04_019496 [Brassica rapa subsp. trilocularis]